MGINKVILVGRLVREPTLETSRGGLLFAKARIEVTAKSGKTIIPIILGGVAAEVLATEIEVGDQVKISGWVHGHEPVKKGKKSIALILSDQIEQVRTEGGRN